MSQGNTLTEAIARLQTLMGRLTEAVERLDRMSVQLDSAQNLVSMVAAEEQDLVETIERLGYGRERLELDKSLARFPIDLEGQTAAAAQDLRALTPSWETALQATTMRVGRFQALPEKVVQAVRQRQAVLERIRTSVQARQEDDRKKLAAQPPPADGTSEEFEAMLIHSGEMDAIPQVKPPLQVELDLQSPHRVIRSADGRFLKGLFVATRESPDLGRAIHLVATLDDGTMIEADGFVAWSLPPEQDSVPGFGLEFVAISDDHRQRLEALNLN